MASPSAMMATPAMAPFTVGTSAITNHDVLEMAKPSVIAPIAGSRRASAAAGTVVRMIVHGPTDWTSGYGSQVGKSLPWERRGFEKLQKKIPKPGKKDKDVTQRT